MIPLDYNLASIHYAPINIEDYLTYYVCDCYYPFTVCETSCNSNSVILSDVSDKSLAIFKTIVGAQVNQSYKLIDHWKKKSNHSFKYECKNKILKHEHKIKTLVSFYADELI